MAVLDGITSKELESIRHRFEEKFIPVTESGCWLWTASIDRGGYGRFRLLGKIEKAHRASWRLYRKAPICGLHVLHRCDVRQCVNPLHLFLGTNAENNADMMAKGRNKTLPGESNGSSKLSERQVTTIRIRRSDGATMTAIAAEFGVTHSTISHIVNRRAWRHI